MTDVEPYIRDAVADELRDDTTDAILETDARGPMFGVLGLDADDRVVVYADDGCLLRYPLRDGEVIKNHEHPERELSELRASPHNAESAVAELETQDWNWIHPRYRWLTDHAPGRQLEIENGP